MLSRSTARPAAIEIVAVPKELAGGVNVPVQELVPVTRVRALMVPADLVMKEVNMPASSSLEVIVRVVVCPIVKVPDPERVMEMLGIGVVESIVIDPV